MQYNKALQKSVHKLTDRLVLLAGIFFPVIILISSLRYFEFGLHPTFIFEIVNGCFLVTLCIFKRRLSFNFKAYALVVAGLYTVCYSIIFYGFVDLGIIYAIVVIVFVATVFSVRQAIVTAVVVLLLIIFLAILHVADILSFVPIDSAEYAGSYIAWLLAISNISLSSMIVLSIIIMYKRLMSLYALKLIRHSRCLTAQTNKLEVIASSDYLTGLRNRRAFVEDFNEFALDLPPGSNIAMVCVDINGFGKINERYGYQAGDKIISQYAKKLLKLSKDSSLPIKHIYRVEGDEFVILTTPLESIENELKLLYSKIKEVSSGRLDIEHRKIRISVKVCAVVYPEHVETVDELIISAKLALNYSRKDKTKLCIYDNSMFENIKRRLTIEKKIQIALAENKFTLVAQNILNIKTKEIVGSEVLIRWHDDTLGDVQPDDFITVAEESGQIKAIDRWVVEEVFKTMSRSNNDNMRYYAINVSVLTLSSSDFIDNIKQFQLQYGVSPQRIVFEITEYIIINQYQEISANLDELKQLGYKISLDDFGTGYSSLSNLANLSVDYLKFDKSFIQSISSPKNKSLMLGTISLVDILGINMIIEGVETAEQLNWLEEIGYDLNLQGFYFHKPEPIT